MRTRAERCTVGILSERWAPTSRKSSCHPGKLPTPTATLPPVQRRIDALLIGSVALQARRGFHVNMFKSLFAGLVIAAATSATASTTINFDDLDAPTSGNQVVPNGYGGLNWTNFN